MNANRNLIKTTINASLVAQALTTLVGLTGVFITLKPEHLILRTILILETLVQIVEGTFYILVSKFFKSVSTSVLAPLRYIDWVFTTPLMLITTVAFMDYNNSINSGQTPRNFMGFLKENRDLLTQIVFYNFLMLLFGVLVEFNIIPKTAGVLLGFIPFLLTFHVIKTNYVKNDKVNKGLFYFMFTIWGLYGVAAMMGNINKNVSYNILDVIAKNFYGIFIFYYILKVSGSI